MLSTKNKAIRASSWASVLLLLISALTLSACSIYSFSGSTLPPHIRTVEIPVFDNATLEPGINDDVTTELSREILRSQLRPANQNADATIRGSVTRYSNRPHTFGAGGAEVQVEQYVVRVSADVEFFDNRRETIIYKGTVSGEGVYIFESEDELAGRDRAVKDLVEKIIRNSVQMW
ncbi:MAG: LPS assembly lipoprotein LptE [Chitinispirillales bacterium]|nr:LPS assembly lipoprotein LptE [Chitinispirillales bacterium]